VEIYLLFIFDLCRPFALAPCLLFHLRIIQGTKTLKAKDIDGSTIKEERESEDDEEEGDSENKDRDEEFDSEEDDDEGSGDSADTSENEYETDEN